MIVLIEFGEESWGPFFRFTKDVAFVHIVKWAAQTLWPPMEFSKEQESSK